MRQLQVVSVSDDGTHVLLAADEQAARATHQLRIDDRLTAAVRGQLDTSDRRPSALTPKEIQARLRAGEPAEKVAKAAKVPVARVLRYAGPVESERDRIVEQARAAHVVRPRGPAGVHPLGETVDKKLAAVPGLRTDTVQWSARRRDDGAWVVALSYSARGGSRSASWLWRPATHDVVALGVAAARLSADDTPPLKRKPARPRANSGRATGSRKAGAPTEAGGPTLPGRVRPRRVQPEKREPEPAAVRRRPARPAPVIDPPARRANGRVSVPSWSDVLLGVQPVEEPAPGRPAVAKRTGRAASAARGRRRS